MDNQIIVVNETSVIIKENQDTKREHKRKTPVRSRSGKAPKRSGDYTMTKAIQREEHAQRHKEGKGMKLFISISAGLEGKRVT